MITTKTATVSLASFTFDSLQSIQFTSNDANKLEAACTAYANAARINREKNTPETAQALEDAKNACEGVVRLFNIKQELSAYYNAPTFDAFFRLGLITQKTVKFGVLCASLSTTVKKPCVTSWLASCARSGVEIEHRAAYVAAVERFIGLLQTNVNAQICNEGKAPSKKDLADSLTAVVQACGLVNGENKPLIMPANAALAIAHTCLRVDKRDVRGLKPVSTKDVESQLFDAVGGQLLRLEYHTNGIRE